MPAEATPINQGSGSADRRVPTVRSLVGPGGGESSRPLCRPAAASLHQPGPRESSGRPAGVSRTSPPGAVRGGLGCRAIRGSGHGWRSTRRRCGGAVVVTETGAVVRLVLVARAHGDETFGLSCDAREWTASVRLVAAGILASDDKDRRTMAGT